MKIAFKRVRADHSSTWRRSLYRHISALGIIIGASVAISFGQSLDEFETASKSYGAGLIPYPDMRRDANSLEDEVTRRQKESAGLGPSDLEPAKNKILKARRYSEEQLRISETKYNKAKSDNPGSFNAWAEDVEKYKSEIEKQNKELEAIDDKIDDGIEALNRFWNARGGLREKFEDVVYQLKSLKSNPSKILGSPPSSSDAAATKEYKEKETELKGYIDTIVSKIEAGVATHRREENITKQGSEDLKTLKGKTAPF